MEKPGLEISLEVNRGPTNYTSSGYIEKDNK
jgi:hypothetical protein